MPISRSDLSLDQRKVYESMLDWVRTPGAPLLTMGGYGGTGKGQPLDALVMTPFGPTKMGELSTGSQVSNPDGSVAKVLLVHELGERDVFRVTFSDGASTLVTSDHLWLCKRSGKHTKADRRDLHGEKLWGRIETTAQLREYIGTQEKLKRTFLPLIPLTEPVSFVIGNHRTGGSGKMPIDPYALGALIGDGGMSQREVILTSADLDIVKRVEIALATKLAKRGRKAAAAYGYYIPVGSGAHAALEELKLKGKLSYDKFIPEGYKLAPIDARLELVQGLMDTDGTVDVGGSVTFTSTSAVLATDMQWMLRSLGYRATITSRIPTFSDSNKNKKKGRRAYTLFIQGRNLSSLFKLERKKSRCRDVFNGGVSAVARRMISIKPEGKAVCRCITVDHPNGLYVTDDFIVTHNSTLLGLFAAEHQHLKIAYVCYTGRASSILGRKLSDQGVATTARACTDDERKLTGYWKDMFFAPDSAEAKRPFCGTIHRLLYRPFIDSVTEELMGWEKRIRLDRNYDLILLDEASMVNIEVAQDIQAHGVRVLAVGDHGQLPPVMSEGSLVSRPMLRLEKIHRQAEGSPIIQLSRAIREEGRMATELADGNRLRFGSKRDMVHPNLAKLLSENKLEAAVLCWKNATRVHVNRTVRSHLGFAGKPPQVGEPLVALRNSPPIFNGMRGLVTKEATSPFKDEFWLMKTEVEFPDDGVPPTELDVCRDQFHRPTPFASVEELEKAGIKVYSMSAAGKLYDFSYAMTVHKFQGSSVKHAVVIADWPANYSVENTRRLAYTAVTRASERLSVLI